MYTYMAKDSITIPDFFENRFNDNSRVLRLVSAIVIIIFFTLYTSSGLVAGGTLFENAFGMDYHYGLLLTAGVVVAYTLIGGLFWGGHPPPHDTTICAGLYHVHRFW